MQSIVGAILSKLNWSCMALVCETHTMCTFMYALWLVVQWHIKGHLIMRSTIKGNSMRDMERTVGIAIRTCTGAYAMLESGVADA